MNHSFFRRWSLALALMGALAGQALAADALPVVQEAPEGPGVLLTETPDPRLGALMLGSRQICAGDALLPEQLSALTFVPAEDASGEAVIACLRMTPDGPAEETFSLRLGKEKNEPPTAEDSEFETYKNIPGQVPLTVSDPENEFLTVTVTRQPRRGAVTVGEDGAVTYTPKENKVGKDSFSYTVTDPSGNVSQEATVRIKIKKPSDQQTYADLDGDPAQLAAVWLRETGVFSGETIDGTLLFCPEASVTRGEFIAMCASLTEGPAAEPVSAGFTDGDADPWLTPYVTTALRCGYLRGVPTAEGLALAASSPVTQAQAAMLLCDMLGLAQPDAEAVMALEPAVPAWAAGASAAMAQAGLLEITDADAPLTRRQAAMLLYAAARYAGTQPSTLLSWAAK